MSPAAVEPPQIASGLEARLPNYAKLTTELEAIAQNGPVTCDDATRKRLLEAVKGALPELEKQDDTAQRVLYTAVEVMAAKIGVNMGLFVKLAESETPLSTEELAQPLGANVLLLSRLLKLIASLKFIKEVDVNKWGPSTTTHHLARRGVAGGVNHNHDNLALGWLELPAYLERTKYQIPTDIRNSAFSQGHGVQQSFFEWVAERPSNFHEFNQWMTAQRYGDEQWLDTVPFKSLVLDKAAGDKPLFVDVGGGIGHQCQALLEQFPSLAGRVILQDQASVIAEALPVDGISTGVIDFFKEQPVKDARVYYMRNVLHDWTDEDCVKILTVMKDAMGPNSMIFLDEMVVPMKGAHKIAMQVDMIMLSALCSEERTEDHWKELIKSAGLKIEHIYTYQQQLGDSIIVATPL